MLPPRFFNKDCCKKLLFLLVLFVSFAFQSSFSMQPSFEEMETESTPLPIPYSLFEKLYFDPHSQTFLGVGKKNEGIFPIFNDPVRPYHFEQVDSITFDASPLYLEGTTFFLFESHAPVMCCHFFHLLEHLVGLWSFDGNEHFADMRRIVLATDGLFDASSWPGPNQMNRHLLKALFPNAVVQTWHEFMQECSSHNGPLVFERAVTSDRALTSSHPMCTRINKLLGAALPHLNKQALDHFAQRLYTYTNTVPARSDQIRITYSKRTGLVRTLADKLERRLITQLSSIPGVLINTVDFAKISFEEQVRLIGNTDILIGVHGNGLSHTLFLPNHASVIEIFPQNSLLLDYRLFADARGLDYYGIVSQRGLVDRETAYNNYIGLTEDTIRELDVDLIKSIVKKIVKKRASNK